MEEGWEREGRKGIKRGRREGEEWRKGRGREGETRHTNPNLLPAPLDRCNECGN